MNNQELPPPISLFATKKHVVLFPGVVIPITVSRDKSIKLIQDANQGDKLVGVVAQKAQNTEEPTKEDMNLIGTVAKIIKMLRMPYGQYHCNHSGQKTF